MLLSNHKVSIDAYHVFKIPKKNLICIYWLSLSAIGKLHANMILQLVTEMLFVVCKDAICRSKRCVEFFL